MPTVLRERGFRFVIFTDDHRPAHVHVSYQEGNAIIEFASEIRIRKADRNLSARDASRAMRIVEENRDHFVTEWLKLYEQI